MRALLVKLSSVLFVAAAAYVASPFVAAWNLREAIKAGNVEVVRDKVQWDTVRASLRVTLAEHPDLFSEDALSADPAKQSLWKRIKTKIGVSAVDQFIAKYVNAEGLPQLFKYRKAWHDNVTGETAALAAQPRLERFKQVYARIRRAEFFGLARVEIELQDRKRADRRYISTMELVGYQWKLTAVRILSVDAAARLAELEARAAASK
jgi:hypothetical protein